MKANIKLFTSIRSTIVNLLIHTYKHFTYIQYTRIFLFYKLALISKKSLDFQFFVNMEPCDQISTQLLTNLLTFVAVIHVPKNHPKTFIYSLDCFLVLLPTQKKSRFFGIVLSCFVSHQEVKVPLIRLMVVEQIILSRPSLGVGRRLTKRKWCSLFANRYRRMKETIWQDFTDVATTIYSNLQRNTIQLLYLA